MSNQVSKTGFDYPTSANYVCIDETNYAVPQAAKEVFVCQRGFLYFNSSIENEVAHNWGSSKKILHAEHPQMRTAFPLRLKNSKLPANSSKRFEAVEKFKCTAIPLDTKLSLVDCTKYNYS